MIYQVTALILSASVATADIGSSLWRTFGHQKELPISSSEAEAAGWVAVTSCEADLGILYAQDSFGPSEKHPLGLRFTKAGQIAGVQATVYGSNKHSDAAPAHLVDLGYWKVSNQTETWTMDVSFREPSAMCSSDTSSDVMGDRVVVNQDTIAYSIPLKAKDARAQDWTPGSCMDSMGQHHFYDLKAAPGQSYESDQLVPVVPMYNPPDETGHLNAFFFTSPVSQPGSSVKYLLTGKADWESPALTSKLMCQNWCDDDNCSWDSSWATMHIYLSDEWKDLKCPHGSGPVGRDCDL